jgi:hypothetical protein
MANELEYLYLEDYALFEKPLEKKEPSKKEVEERGVVEMDIYGQAN